MPEICCRCQSCIGTIAYDVFIEELGLVVTSYYCPDCYQYRVRQSLFGLAFGLGLALGLALVLGLGLGLLYN